MMGNSFSLLEVGRYCPAHPVHKCSTFQKNVEVHRDLDRTGPIEDTVNSAVEVLACRRSATVRRHALRNDVEPHPGVHSLLVTDGQAICWVYLRGKVPAAGMNPEHVTAVHEE